MVQCTCYLIICDIVVGDIGGADGHVAVTRVIVCAIAGTGIARTGVTATGVAGTCVADNTGCCFIRVCHSEVGHIANRATRMRKLYVVYHRFINWQIRARQHQLPVGRCVSEVLNLTYRHHVIEVARQVLAHSRVLTDLHDDLWLHFVSAEHFEGYGRVEKSISSIYEARRISHPVASKRVVSTRFDNHARLIACSANKTDIVRYTIVSV